MLFTKYAVYLKVSCLKVGKLRLPVYFCKVLNFLWKDYICKEQSTFQRCAMLNCITVTTFSGLGGAIPNALALRVSELHSLSVNVVHRDLEVSW